MLQLYKLKITLATTNCGEGDFDKKGVLTHLSIYDLDEDRLRNISSGRLLLLLSYISR